MRKLFVLTLLMIAEMAQGLPLDCQKSLAITDGPAPAVDEFRPLGARENAFGFSDKTYWIRLACKESFLDSVYLEIDYPHLDDVQIFVGDDLERPVHHLGDRLPFPDRILKIPQLAVPVRGSELSQGLVVRVQSRSSLQIPIVLRSESEFLERQARSNLVQGLYFGLILAMIILNVWLFALAGERMVIDYIGYLFTFGVLQMTMNGWAYAYLLPESPGAANMILPASVWLTFATMMRFSHSFLRLDRFARFAGIQLKTLEVLCFMLAGASLFVDYSTAIRPAVWFGMISAPLLFLIALWISRTYAPARFFLAAWAVFLLGTVLLNLKNLGFLPANGWTDSSAQIGSALQILFLSAGVGWRLRVREQERQSLKISRQLAHDIRAPLSALKIAASTLPPSAAAHSEILHSAVERIMGISQDLFEPNRSLALAVTDLDHTLDVVLKEFRALTQSRDRAVEIRVARPGNAVLVLAPETELKRTLSNLLVNAWEAGATKIDLRLMADRESILDIQDNGCGIPQKYLARLEAGESLSTKPMGQGLGLSAAVDFALRCHGRLKIESLPESGTCVRLFLPLAAVRQSEDLRIPLRNGR